MTEIEKQEFEALERRIGTEAFLKGCIGAINRVLVLKGICTETELKWALEKSIEEPIEERYRRG